MRKEESIPDKEKTNEVKSSEKADRAGNGENVIIEQLGSAGAELEPDEMFDEELQPTDGIYSFPVVYVYECFSTHILADKC